MRIALALLVSLALVPPAFGQFVDDEFNVAGSLGAQWTTVDSTPAGSTFTLTGSHFQLTAMEGSDFWFPIDGHAYIQQNAPLDESWEVVTKIDNFDPRTPGFQRDWNRSGIQIWQDNEHWIATGIMGDDTGTRMLIETTYQTSPVAPDHGAYQGDYKIWDITTSPIYLKIEKTKRGYVTSMSGDGTNWEVTSQVIRNSGSATGYFTSEKVRLFQSGGPTPVGTEKSHPADFDWVRAQALTPYPGGCKNDEFSGAGLDTSIWGTYHGLLAGTITQDSGKLKMTSGPGQDHWIDFDRAMFVFQDAPTSSSYGVSIKAGPTDLVPNEQWNGYGIMIWQDQNNWVMCTNQRSEFSTNRLEVAYQFNNTADFFVYQPAFGTGPLPEYLKIEKRDDTYCALYSFDNLNWVELPTGGHVMNSPMPNPQVRLISKRVFDNGTPVTAEFDWFHVTPIASSADDWQLFE